MTPDLEALLDRSGWARRLARRLVGDADAEDLVQEAAIAALQNPPGSSDLASTSASSESSLRKWLARVLANAARQRWRAGFRRRDLESRVEQGSSELGPEELGQRLEAHRAIVDAVSSLDEPYRSTVLLRYFEELSPAEIARRTNTPRRTVHSRLNRAHALLRRKLGGGFGDARGGWLAAVLPLLEAKRPPLLCAWSKPLMLGGTLVVNAKALTALAAAGMTGVLAVTVLWTAAEPKELERQKVVVPSEDRAALVVPDELEPGSLPSESPREPAAPTAEPEHQEALGAQPAVASNFLLRGRILDVSGLPAAGLAIARIGFSGELLAETKADGAGRFEFQAGADPDGKIQVREKGWMTVLEPTLFSDTEEELLLVVARSLPLAGLVLDPERAPVVGAEVEVMAPDDLRADIARDLARSRTLRWRASSDELGHFELVAPAIPGARLMATAPGYKHFSIEVPGEPSFDLTLVLQKQGSDSTLAGRVIDAGGDGISDAYVSLGRSGTKSDATGRFALAIDPDGEADNILWAAKAGLLPAHIERDPAGSWPDPIELVLAGTTFSIQGRVLDEQGRPVAGAQVWTNDTTHFGAIEIDDFGPLTTVGVEVEGILSGQLWSRPVETDGDGKFSLKGLLARDYRLSVLDQPTLRHVLSDPIPAGRSGVEIRLRDEVLGTIGGKVLSLEGDPLARVRVAPLRLREPDEATPSIEGREVWTDDEGRFLLERISRDVAALSVSGSPVGLGKTWKLPAGADLESLEIRVARRCQFRIELSPARQANSFSLLDTAGEAMQIVCEKGDIAWSQYRPELTNGRSEVLASSEEASTLVLYLDESETARIPIRLRAGEVNVLRP